MLPSNQSHKNSHLKSQENCATNSIMTEREPISGSSRDYGSTAAPPTVAFADFSPTELYNLSEGIADNVNTINNGLQTLQRLMKKIGGTNDSVQLRDEIHDTQQSVNGSISATARDIQRLGVVVRRGDKPQKLQVERLTQVFRDTLARYSSMQKELTEKMAAHMPTRGRERSDLEGLRRQAREEEEESALLDQQQAQARLIQFESSMMLEKEAYMSRIEADVLDVNQIMHDLREMVTAQGHTVDTVEGHIEAASAGVEAGVDELAKAAEHQRRYRKKMFFFTLIGIILAIIFIVWVVKAFKN